MAGQWTETKIKPRLWKFQYVYYTRKRPKTGRYNTIRATQHAIKVSPNTYKLIMTGQRKPTKRFRKLYKHKTF